MARRLPDPSPQPKSRLRALAPDLWVAEHPIRFLGVEVGTRMTVVQLADGALFAHSPVAPDEELDEELESLGPVQYLVAPNRFHHLFLADFAAAHPQARCFVAPGLREKRPDLGFASVLDDEPPPAWAGQVDQRVFRGAPLLNEVVFFHRASRTLLLCDLACNVGPGSAGGTRLAFRLAGAYGRFGPTRLERWFAVRDRRAARASLEHILEWDFDRVIVSHGEVLETGGRDALRRGYAWLLQD
jgi:hypothetical protein